MFAPQFRPFAIYISTALAVVLASCAPAAPPTATSAPAAIAKPAAPQPSPAGQEAKPAAKAAKALTRLEFAMPFVPPTEYVPFVMAQEKGFYAAEGLDVNLNDGTGSANTVKVVGAGTLPIGLADANPMLAGLVQGVPVTPIMTYFYVSPVMVVSLKEKGITRLDDLIGKKLGSPAASGPLKTWRVAMTRAGLDPDKVNFVAIEGAGIIPALLAGQVDAVIGQSTAADILATGTDVNVIPIEFAVVSDSFFANNSFLQKEPETVRAFLRATIKGVNYVKENQAESLAAMARRFPTVDPKKLELRQKFELGWVWTKNTPTDRFGWQDLSMWTGLQDLMFETGQIDKKIDLAGIVKNDYLPYK